MFCLVASSLGDLRICGSSLQRGHRGSAEGSRRFQQLDVTGSKARKGDRVRTIANSFAVLRPGKPAIHREFASSGSVSVQRMGDLADGPRRVAGGCSGYFGFGVCELVNRDSFVLRA